jgi:hypothetical protein
LKWVRKIEFRRPANLLILHRAIQIRTWDFSKWPSWMDLRNALGEYAWKAAMVKEVGLQTFSPADLYPFQGSLFPETAYFLRLKGPRFQGALLLLALVRVSPRGTVTQIRV